MNASASLSGDPVFGLLAILSLGVILFLVRDALREFMRQRRNHRGRQR